MIGMSETDPVALVERDDQLAVLSRIAEGLDRRGRVVAIVGEAGAGKTSLLRAFAATVATRLDVRVGRCDDLATPASLAPLWDMAPTFSGSVTAALTAGERSTLFATLMEQLRRSPSLFAVDDAQWADQATLDLIRHVGRRVEQLPALVCISYRVEEVRRDHPLRALLGELGDVVERINVPALSLAAVRRLAEGHDVNVARLYEQTRGNAFFVTSLIENSGVDVPVAVGDAVLARTTMLSGPAWAVLDAVALAPEGIPISIVSRLGEHAEQGADAAIERGLLELVGGRLRCRHDLVRAALAETIAPVRRRRLHQTLVELLVDRVRTSADVAQLAYHAVAGDDGARAVEYSMRAGSRAAKDGAHREAARHYANTLAFRSELDETTLETALDRCSYESYLSHDLETALACAAEMLDLRTDDLVTAGRRQWWCARLAHFAGRNADAERYARRAVELLESGDDSLYEAYARWWLAHLTGDHDAVVHWGMGAAALARERGELDIASHMLNSVGSLRAARDDPTGPTLLEEALVLADSAGSLEQAARAYNNLAHEAMIHRRFDAAERWFDEGMGWTADRDLAFWWDAMLDSRVMLRLYQGRWNQAMADAERTLSRSGELDPTQLCAAVTRATILLRRGDGESGQAVATIDKILEHADPDPFELIRRAESRWTSGDDDPAERRELAAALSTLLRTGDRWHASGLAFWLTRSDPSFLVDLDPGLFVRPLSLELSGDREGAVAAWDALGCGFEAAVVQGGSDELEDLRNAFAQLGRLGASATIAALRREATVRGVRLVPRGERPATIADPHGLTSRQVEVLALLGEHLTDAEIADRLFISQKTVSHHVSAILAKLGVANRREAGTLARHTG